MAAPSVRVKSRFAGGAVNLIVIESTLGEEWAVKPAEPSPPSPRRRR
jgi:hypothetical protein